ncbi:MAG: glutamate formimidoyltransferase [Clostridiales bacterium]|jgi:glutamate formiminotransferase|nr:glutamate formimidoyltransferase [Clostridiales bacterium]
MQIIECVPNFSEGRNEKVINLLAQTAQKTAGVMLLGVSSDYDHNRSVITIAGNESGIEEAAFLLCKTAAENIDLRQHEGVHPRMGAADVIPFIPLQNCGIETCINLSKRVGKRIADELKIPVFLYEHSATNEERKNLAAIRKGGFEGMSEKILLENWQPDYGERKINQSAGVCAVGARYALIAFNVNLNTGDIKIAKKIAAKIRESGGGLKTLKAIGVSLNGSGLAQVSMNVTNYEVTSMHDAFCAVKEEAKRYGVSVLCSEVVGFVPARALAESARRCLMIKDFNYDTYVLEAFGICVSKREPSQME